MSFFDIFKRKSFPFLKQRFPAECGTVCIAMISEYYGKPVAPAGLNEWIRLDEQTGASLLQLQKVSEHLKYETVAARLDIDALRTGKFMPCILFWDGVSFVVAYDIGKYLVKIANPATGLEVYSRDEFCDYWYCNPEHEDTGVMLHIKPKYP